MPDLLSQLVADAQLSLDFKMENADMPSGTDKYAMNVKVKGLGEQRVSLNTEALVKKTSAFGLLDQVSENMGPAFEPYVEALLPIVTLHMAYQHSKAIRKFALKIFKNILISVGEYKNIELFQKYLFVYTHQINKALEKHDEKTVKQVLKQLANTLRALNAHNKYQRAFLTQDQINSMGPIIKNTLDLINALRAAT